MKILTFIPAISIFLVLGLVPAQNKKDDSTRTKEVFQEKFPLTLSFRNDKLGLRDDFTYWETAHLPFNSITKKYLKEEVDMPPIIAEWANKYAEKNPDKLMLIHLNGEGRSVNDPDMHKLYFPGHWIYEEGSFPLTDIDNKQSTIALESAQPFSEKVYPMHSQSKILGKLPHDLIIIELDEKGNRNWANYEFAQIKNVDYENNSIIVKRGMYHTKKRGFKKGKTYIAPLAGDFWGGNLMWYYNLSATCPLDENGRSAADVFVGEMKNWFGKNGILEHIDGIGFDVNYFTTDHKTWDCNNDGKADQGFVGGKNIWRLGDIDFLKKIRAAFGDEFIITADGWRDEMQRAVGILNGMETEGLCRPNDGYRQISRTINQHVYWSMNNDTKYRFSYITGKLRHPDDGKLSTRLQRLGMAVSSCLGVAYAYGAPRFISEAVGGSLSQINWLGKPLEAMKYAFTDATDLLNGEGLKFNPELVSKFGFDNEEHKVVDNALHIKGKSKNVYEDMVISGPEIDIPEGDLVVVFEAKAIEGFHDLKTDSLIPRKINVKLEGLPKFPVEPMNAQRFHNELAGFMGMKDYTPQMFYFRKVGNSDKKLKILLEAEEQGEFAIRNLKIYNAPLGIYREFENGVVLVNPSLSSLTFDLKKISGEDKQYRRIKAVKPNEGRFNEDLKEVMEYNNGEAIINDKVTVPYLNALFLIKQ